MRLALDFQAGKSLKPESSQVPTLMFIDSLDVILPASIISRSSQNPTKPCCAFSTNLKNAFPDENTVRPLNSNHESSSGGGPDLRVGDLSLKRTIEKRVFLRFLSPSWKTFLSSPSSVQGGYPSCSAVLRLGRGTTSQQAPTAAAAGKITPPGGHNNAEKETRGQVIVLGDCQ